LEQFDRMCFFLRKIGLTWYSRSFFSLMKPYYIIALLIFGLTTYISLDVALGVTQTIGAPSNPADSLHSISLFVLLNMWPPLYVHRTSPAVVKLILSPQNRDNLLRSHDVHRSPGAQREAPHVLVRSRRAPFRPIPARVVLARQGGLSGSFCFHCCFVFNFVSLRLSSPSILPGILVLPFSMDLSSSTIPNLLSL
jgi:hypothetical protein